jgi:plastocyanin
MTTMTPVVLIQGSLLTAAIATYYTAPALTKVRIGQMILVNTDVLAHTVSIWLAPNSGIAGNSDKVVTVNLAAGQSYSVYQANGLILDASGTIQAQADTSSLVTFKASGTLIN